MLAERAAATSSSCDGDELKASGEDLEDWWTAWQDPLPPNACCRTASTSTRSILGCSVGVFPYIAKELIAASPPLATMVDAVGTTQTQAAQLWIVDRPRGPRLDAAVARCSTATPSRWIRGPT